MTRQPWVKWFPADFLNGVSDLDPTEGWVYTILLNMIYDGAGPVAMNEVRLARRCRMRPTSFRAAVDSLVEMGKLTLEAGLISNPRAAKVLETRAELVAKSSIAATARWENRDRKLSVINGGLDAAAMRPHLLLDEKPEARSQKLEKKERAGARTEGLVTKEVVERIWASAPSVSRRRSSQSNLESALKGAIKRGADLTDLESRMRGYFQTDDATREDGRYCIGVDRLVRTDRWKEAEPAQARYVMPLDEYPIERWEVNVREWRATRLWDTPRLGPAPGQPGCKVPPAALR